MCIRDRNETAVTCQVVAPDHHFLEAWDDAEPKKGMFSLQQPTIRNMFDTRQAQDSLLKWAGDNTTYNVYLKNYWQQNFTSKQSEFASPASFWNNTCLLYTSRCV